MREGGKMKNTTFYEHNAYMTLEDGTIYRACHISGKWKLYKQDKRNTSKYIAVNDENYDTAMDALEAVTA